MHLSLNKRKMIVRDKFLLDFIDALTLRRSFIIFKLEYIRPNCTYWKSFAEKNFFKLKLLAFMHHLGTLIHGWYNENIL